MDKTVTKGVLTMPETRPGKEQLLIELAEILATEILQFAAFEQVPNPFLRIELGCISRQTFQMNAGSRTSRQKVFDHLAVMDGRTIPDNQQLPRNLAQELLEKAHHIWSLVGVILGLHEQSPLWCQRSDGRDMVTGELHAQERRLAHGSIGPHRHGKPGKSPTRLQTRAAAFPARLFFESRPALFAPRLDGLFISLAG